MKRIVFTLILVFILLLIGLWVFRSYDTKEKVLLKVNRFEQELFSITPKNVKQKSNLWNKKFDTFNEVFASQIIKVSIEDNELYCSSLIDFVQNKDMREAYDSTASLFVDFSEIKYDLDHAFNRFHLFFPTYPLPQITTFFGGFNYGVVTYDNNIAIGLENFMGQNSKYYKFLGDPKYLRFQKQRRFILSNVMEVWFNNFFQKYSNGRDFLSQIVYKGKMMYFIDKMLPDISMENKFRFTTKQMEWVEINEVNIWEYFVHKDLLFSSQENTFRSFLAYAPFAKGMPKEAPARVAYYIGYKMVCEFMKNNKIELEELLYLTDSRQFLKESKYKPNK